MDLMCEILGKNKNEENKNDDKNNFNNKEIINNNFDINFFKKNKQLFEENSFINPLKIPLDVKLENEKMFQDENFYLKI